MSRKSILQKILGMLARATIRTYEPMVIAVTGSVGKTSTRMAIFAVLKKKFFVRTAEKNYNNEIGVALTILQIPHCGKNIFGWARALAGASARLILRDHRYPDMLILEYGIDHPWDMDYLLSLARPAAAVVTAMGEVPAHVEFFADAEAVIREKTKLVAALPPAGMAILNHDDMSVYDMKTATKARVLTYGREAHAEIKIIHYELRTGKDAVLGDIPAGVSFKIEYKGSVVPVRLDGVFGITHSYAAAAAAAVGITLKMNLVEISEALHAYVPPPGRMRLIAGIKHSFILDDTYNASPESMRAALATLGELPVRRKIAVLGDMLEIGTYTEGAHRAIGDVAVKTADVIFCVGARAKFIADEAIQQGFSQKNIFIFDESRAAGRALDPLIEEGDLILVKGSQGMRMERVVEEIMRRPEQAKDLLVRQEKHWRE